MELHETDLLFKVLGEIDNRTKEIDTRLRTVEQRINNGIHEKVTTMWTTTTGMQKQIDNICAKETYRQKTWKVAYLVIGIGIGVAGVMMAAIK